MMVYMGRLCLKRVPFSGFRYTVYERVGISLVEVYGGMGKSVILVCKKAQGLTNAFHFILFFFWGGGGGCYPSNGLTLC